MGEPSFICLYVCMLMQINVHYSCSSPRHCHSFSCCILTLGYCARIPFAAQAPLLYSLQMLYLRGCWGMRWQCRAVCTASCRGVGCMRWMMMVMGGRARTIVAHLLWQRLSSTPQCWAQIVRDFRL